MSDIPDISAASDLKPRVKYFEEIGDNAMNIDACIELARSIDTPQAKAIYRAFRRHLAHCRTSMKGQKPEKIREEAWFLGLTDLGFKVSFKKISGTMDQ